MRFLTDKFPSNCSYTRDSFPHRILKTALLGLRPNSNWIIETVEQKHLIMKLGLPIVEFLHLSLRSVTLRVNLLLRYL